MTVGAPYPCPMNTADTFSGPWGSSPGLTQPFPTLLQLRRPSTRSPPSAWQLPLQDAHLSWGSSPSLAPQFSLSHALFLELSCQSPQHFARRCRLRAARSLCPPRPPGWAVCPGEDRVWVLHIFASPESRKQLKPFPLFTKGSSLKGWLNELKGMRAMD